MPYIVHGLRAFLATNDGDPLGAMQAKLNEWEEQGFTLHTVINEPDMTDPIVVLHQPLDNRPDMPTLPHVSLGT
jgi:hypothetical protein